MLRTLNPLFTKLLILLAIAAVGGVAYATRQFYLPYIMRIIVPSSMPAAQQPQPAAAQPDGATPAAPEKGYPQGLRKKLALARQHLTDDRPLQARQLLANALKDPDLTEYGPAWIETAELLSEVNAKFLFSDAPCPEKVTHLVVSGDSLWKIATKYNVTVAMIQKSNKLDPNKPNIFAGQELKFYKGTWRIDVSKSNFLLRLWDGDTLVKIYHVAIGRQDRTPVGDFVIDNKEREPAWTPPGKNIPYGDPENVLGARWLGLKAANGTSPSLKGYGIHGTTEPDSIGKPASNGCVRMRNEEVSELFDIVTVGTPVHLSE